LDLTYSSEKIGNITIKFEDMTCLSRTGALPRKPRTFPIFSRMKKRTRKICTENSLKRGKK
jgi:hypothetical protein